MNRLIILGNGFDIAHGMKTSVNDFITDYFCNAVKYFLKNHSYSDILLTINYLDTSPAAKRKHKVSKESVYKITESLITSNEIDFKFNSLLLSRIYSATSKLKWLDIEVKFFDVLLFRKNRPSRKGVDEIKNVNEHLEFLKIKLVEYLKKQEKQFSNTSDKTLLSNCFCEEIFKNEIVTTLLKKNEIPEHLHFLNFNYTNTFEDYLEICKKKIPSDYNYIHGSLAENRGKPIFGFGDEFNKEYLEFEDKKNNDLFKHIKSFEYLQTSNFYKLTRFIESDDFQVHIYGHSCGISDRTMLNQIFEHDYCKSIKIFYHKIDEEHNDFTDKTYEISRHFKDKTMFRKKLIPFDLSREMPQPILKEK